MLVISQEYLIAAGIFKLPDYLLRDTAASRLKIVVAEHC